MSDHNYGGHRTTDRNSSEKMREALSQERERVREWHELVNKVALQQQTISYMQLQISELRDTVAQAIRARDAAIDSIRQKDLPKLAEALDEKQDKEAFDEFKIEIFNPVKNKAEASSQFQTKAMMLVSVIVLVIPAVVTAVIKHFWP